MKRPRPRFERCEHARAIPNIVAYRVQLRLYRCIMAAFGTEFRVQHIVFNSQLCTVSRSVQRINSSGCVEVQVNSRRHHMTEESQSPFDGLRHVSRPRPRTSSIISPCF